MTKIAMWSGPRSISTALMRSFENRPDTLVNDEPFYAHYLKETGVDHPMREKIIERGNTNWQNVQAEITGPIPGNKKIWYQKHMAQHNLPGFNLQWVEKMTNCILIRHPKEVILSYAKKFEISSISQMGYPQQLELFNMLNGTGVPPLVMDAGDVLKDPERMLKILCRNLNIPFYNEMLSWPVGRRQTDGIWGEYWYRSVEASTGFHPYVEKTGDLPSKYQNIYNNCMDGFEKLHMIRLQ